MSDELVVQLPDKHACELAEIGLAPKPVKSRQRLVASPSIMANWDMNQVRSRMHRKASMFKYKRENQGISK